MARVSTDFVILLGVTVLAVGGARWSSPALPVRRGCIRLSAPEGGTLLVGLAILGFHCGAMFFTNLVEWLPGTAGPIADIRALGTVSLIWYSVPALMVAFGLRRLPWYGSAGVVVALLGIAITMYDGGPLHVHLTAIFLAVLLVSTVLAALVSPPLP